MCSGGDGPSGVEHLDPVLRGGSSVLSEQSCSGLLLSTQVPAGGERQQVRERNNGKDSLSESIPILPWPFTNDANHEANRRENNTNV